MHAVASPLPGPGRPHPGPGTRVRWAASQAGQIRARQTADALHKIKKYCLRANTFTKTNYLYNIKLSLFSELALDMNKNMTA